MLLWTGTEKQSSQDTQTNHASDARLNPKLTTDILSLRVDRKAH